MARLSTRQIMADKKRKNKKLIKKNMKDREARTERRQVLHD